MQSVSFIDTSVLCNLIPVPGKDQDRDRVQAEHTTRMENGQQLVLPITTVIETGNFIAQIADGNVRRSTALKFDKILRLICANAAPWILHDVAWGQAFLEKFLDGAGTGMNYVQHAQNRVGSGDLCILTERLQYVERTRIPTDVWTLDAGLDVFHHNAP